jgi:hypothetical protein
MSDHSSSTANHPPYAAVYANAAARTAATGFARGLLGVIIPFDSSDLRKWAHQLDDDSFWFLKTFSPPTWGQVLGGGNGSTDTIVVLEVPTGTVDGTNPTFVLANTPISLSEAVFIDGALGRRGVDYALSGPNITAIVIPQQWIVVSYRYAGTPSGGTPVDGETPSGTVDGSNTSFVLANAPISNSEAVFIDGALARRGVDYTISGANITAILVPQQWIAVSYRY